MARNIEKNKAQGLSSSVVAGATVLPIAIGAGITGHSIYRSRNDLVEVFARSNLSRNSRVQDVVNNIINNSSVPSFTNIGEEIAALRTGIRIGKDQVRELDIEAIRTAWGQAARTITDPALASKIQGELATATTTRQFLDTLSIQLKGGSIYTNRAASMFMTNIHAMRSSLRTGLPMGIVEADFMKIRPNISQYTMGGKFKGAEAILKRYVGLEGATTDFITMTGGIFGEREMKLRLSRELGRTGIVASGVGGQTHNIVGTFAIWENNRITGMMGYDDWVRRRMTNEIPELIQKLGTNATQNQIDAAARAFEEQLRQPFEYMPQTYTGTIADEQRVTALLAKHRVNIVDPAGKPITGKELESFYAQAATVRLPRKKFRRMFPLSPNMVSQAGPTDIVKFTTMDPAAWGAFPELVSYARRPGQMHRPFFPTNQAITEILADPLTRRHATTVGRAFARADSEYRHLFKTPATRTLYTTQSPIPALSEGQFAVSRRMKELYNVTELQNITLAAESVAQGTLGLKPGQALDPDMLLGFTTEGEAIMAGPGATFVGAQAFPRELTGNKGLMKLAIRRTHQAEEYQKFFGIKGTAHFMNENIMRGYDVIAHIDELRKNRSMLNKQVFTALTEFNYENMNTLESQISSITGRMEHAKSLRNRVQRDIDAINIMTTSDPDRFTPEIMDRLKALGVAKQKHVQAMDLFRDDIGSLAERLEYLKTYDPEKLMPRLRGMLAGGAVDSTVAIKEMASWARAMHMSPEQAGLIFGAVPAATGLGREQMVSQLGFQENWMQYIMKGEAMGISHLYSAGPKALTGAGVSRASVEPRVFELLAEGQLGPLSGVMREDLLARRMLLDPENQIARAEIAKTMRGVAGMAESLPRDARVLDIASADITKHTFDPLDPNFLGAQGPAYVNMRGLGGIDHLYVPGRGTFKDFTPYAMQGEKAVASPLMRGYEQMLNAARAAAADPEQLSALGVAKGAFTKTLYEAHVGAMYGKGGIQRGEIFGSRFLTGISTARAGEDIFRVGVGREAFGNMIAEMESVANRTIADKAARAAHIEQLHELTRTFMKGGEVGGYMLRHPLFEPFSIVPVRMRLDRKLGADAVDIPFLTKTATIQGMQGKVDLNWSLVKGMGGDFDADIYGMIIGDPNRQAEIIRGATMGAPATRAFEDYAIRQQLIKARTAKDVGLTSAQALSGDIHKMALSGQIGKLSFEMSKARLALIQYGGGGRDVTDALSLLAWTEQNIISGKHATAAQAANLPGQIEDLITNIRNPSPGMGTFQNIVNQTMDDTGRAILNQDLVMDIAGEGRRVIPGVNMPNAMEALGSSLRKFDDHFGSEVSELRKWMTTTGRKAIKPSEIAAYLSMSAVEGAATKGVGKAMATTSIEMANRIATVGRKSVARYGKPLAIGFGASLALAAIMSNPVSNLDPMDPPIVDAKFNNSMGRQMNGMNLQSPQLGQPTGPRMATPPAPMAQQGNPMSAMISVRGRSSGRFDPSTTSDAFRQRLGPGTRINTRVQDDRRNMNAQKVSEILSR